MLALEKACQLPDCPPALPVYSSPHWEQPKREEEEEEEVSQLNISILIKHDK